MSSKLGIDLKVGDTIKVWWSSKTNWPNRDTIVSIRRLTDTDLTKPSTKRMLEVFPGGYAFATFLSGVSMTIDFEDYYEMGANLLD